LAIIDWMLQKDFGIKAEFVHRVFPIEKPYNDLPLPVTDIKNNREEPDNCGEVAFENRTLF